MKKKKGKKIQLCDIIDNEIKDNSLRNGFPKSFDSHIKQLKTKKIINHKDFTDIPFVTIDGQDSKDFDDAVWSETKKGITNIMIAISDVSFFIEKNDPLDLEAKKRGNSFYFPDRVIPMFPNEISNDICSLIPNKERASVITEIKIKNFKVISFKIHRAKIISVARLTYNEVDRIFFSNEKKNRFYSLVKNLFECYRVLKILSEKKNKINFVSDEFEIIENKNKNFVFKKKKSLESYKLIEELMVIANENIAKFIKNNNLNSIFRNHEKPKLDKINELKKMLRDNSIITNSKFNNQKDFINILNYINKDNFFLNDALLKTQSKAFYSCENFGHFGLGLDYYTHFTSPIRRYSDLRVHRDVLDFVFEGKKNSVEKSLDDHLTSQEKKSDSIERKILERACSLYIKFKKIKYFYGTIDAIENFGIFIRAIDLPFSCLVRNKNRYFRNSKFKSQENSFRIGQKVSFKIKRNDIFSGKILGENVKIIN